jgi:UDP-N-acetylglucosamine:LPS N-acetylglucosamine transferase
MTRVLILTASVGEGHDLPARTLADQLRSEDPGVDVVVEDGFRAMGRGFVLVNERAPAVIFFRFCWLWHAALGLFRGLAPTRRATQALVRKLGSRGVLRLVSEVAPDVVVSVYPMTTEVLGGLRRTGRLGVPVVAAITDLAMMHYWAAPGIDLHLITHPESEAEVQQVAGHDAVVQAVHGLTRPEFGEPRTPEARRVPRHGRAREDRGRLGVRLGRRRSRQRGRRGARGRRGGDRCGPRRPQRRASRASPSALR